jgi:hypothetical protein
MMVNSTPSPPHLQRVGAIAAAWADLDFHIEGAIWLLADVSSSVGACVTANFVSIHPKLKSVIALAHLCGMSKATITKLQKFRTGLYGTTEKRNRAIHDQWITLSSKDETHQGQMTITTDGEPKFYARYVSLNELDEIEKEILSQIDRFKDIVDVMKVQLGALRKKQQQPPAPIPRD